jgi:hypothetical protein
MLSGNLIVRPLTADEVPACVPFAQKFHAEMKLPGTIIPDVFLKNWLFFLANYPSVILSLWKNGELVGGLGAMIAPDILDGRLCANEFFWFVDPAHRSGRGAILLLTAYEKWAAKHGAVEVRMLHLIGGETENTLSRFYERRGYRLIEMAYRKPL